MAWVMLHRFFIAKHNPCNPHWRLSVEELELNDTAIKRRANKGDSNLLTVYGRKFNLNVWVLLFLNYKHYTTVFL